MTAQKTEPTQKRLHSCVLAQPKPHKVHEKPRQNARSAIKASDFVAETIARVENAPEKA